MMIIVQEIDSGINIFNSKSASKLSGGPGKAGITHPIIPTKEIIIPTKIKSVSIFCLLSFFDFSFCYHNIF